MLIVRLVYNLLLIVFYPAIIIALFISNFRRGSLAHFGEYLGFIKLDKPINSSGAIWFHASSVGEVRSIAPIIESLKKQMPEKDIIISTMTVNGRDIAKEIANHAFLIPIENAIVIKKIIQLFNAKTFFIVDTELWPNLLLTASENSKLIMINARISDKTYDSYKLAKPLFSYLLKKVSIIFTKSDEDTDRYRYFVKNKVQVVKLGNIKFNKRKKIKDVKPLPMLKDKKYILASSTHNDEEAFFIDAFLKSKLKNTLVVIAPRHINRADEIKNIAHSFNLTAKKLSENDTDTDILIIDKFGILEPLYAYADKVFIGGSIANIGGHNIFEALQFEKPIASGRKLFNFREIQSVADNFELITYVDSSDELAKYFKKRDTNLDFATFFKTIEKENKEVVEKIIGSINK